MPKENKKRGRREEKKRKRADEEETASAKKQKPEPQLEPDPQPDVETHVRPHRLEEEGEGDEEATNPLGAMPFYGLLDEHEQEYFRRADEMLELNQFTTPEERVLFLENVYREVEGKELKVANSQSCSRLMERLIMLSTPKQLKNLFEKFSGQFLHLVQHRFASHCCETLFVQSAPIVTKELTAPLEEDEQKSTGGDVYVTMENLFLYTLNELEGNLGYLMTDRFASHTLRVLLVVLSGQPLAKSSTTSLLQSKKKEKIAITGMDNKPAELSLDKRTVPDSFQIAVDKMITETVSGLDTTYLRALATHPTGNPVLQLLLELELSRHGKAKAKAENSIMRKLLPDDLSEENTESASFINGLLYDPIGSRLLETIIKYAPGKTFKALYRTFLKERLGTLARNEVAGFAAIRALERLSKEDLEQANILLSPKIPVLLELSRTAVVKTLIERCAARGADITSIEEAFADAYGHDAENGLLKTLKLYEAEHKSDDQSAIAAPKPDGQRLHGSLLVQSMLTVAGPLSGLVFDELLALPRPALLQMAKDPISSHILQISLTSTTSTPAFRRKMIPSFYGLIGELAINPSGSHLVDALWTATQGLLFIRERIAEELKDNETLLRDLYIGRAIWRNWMMDLYKRRKFEWLAKGKATDGEATNSPTTKEPAKSGIALAREKFAIAKAKKEKLNKSKGSHARDANSVPVTARVKSVEQV
ncbi:MAG: hypothetical protein M1819_003067 [Sarea resinae]|nr:MAG: hypothetical protein M1819_003067 [Sarea resinae]